MGENYSEGDNLEEVIEDYFGSILDKHYDKWDVRVKPQDSRYEDAWDLKPTDYVLTLEDREIEVHCIYGVKGDSDGFYRISFDRGDIDNGLKEDIRSLLEPCEEKNGNLVGRVYESAKKNPRSPSTAP